MCYQVKATIVSLCTTILGSTLYLLKILSMQREGSLKLTERLSDWGSVILILIGVLIVFQIVIHIIFSIINKIVTDEDAVSFNDELDKLIDLKSSRVAYWIFILAFVSGLFTLVGGQPLWVLFTVTSFGMVLSGIAGDVVKLVLYRRGG